MALRRRVQEAYPIVFRAYYRRALSSTANNNCTSDDIGSNARDCGAWTLLAALEKSKEADNVKVAHLVSSLGNLLPRAGFDEVDTSSEQHTTQHSLHSSDPAFYSIPDPTNNNITKKEVLGLLQATLRGRRIDFQTLEALLKAATDHFHDIPSVVVLPQLEPSQQLTVVGDLHGSLTDLNTVLGLIGNPSHNNMVLFNGDLADRGDHGVEVIAIVCALLLAFPKKCVYLNRGNHEDLALSVAYGLAAEVQHKYGTSSFRQRLGPLLDKFFRSLPLITVVKHDALIVHGGPPPPGMTLEILQQRLAHEAAQADGGLSSRTSRVQAAQQLEGADATIPKNLDADMIVESCLWSDPDIDEDDGTLVNYLSDKDHFKPNVSRGAGFKFDATIVRNLLEQEGLSRLIRSHEPVHKGCARYTLGGKNYDSRSDEMELFTVFSASRYPYKQGFNYGAILRLQPGGKHEIVRFSTEEDEPLIRDSHHDMIDFEAEVSRQTGPGQVDSASIRQALLQAIATRRSALGRALDEAAFTNDCSRAEMPFRQSMDVLVRTLNLEGGGLSRRGPMVALARALTKDSEDDDDAVLPDNIDMAMDLLGALDAWSDREDGGEVDPEAGSPIASGWLKAVFSMVDSNHDDEIDKSEWLTAVDKINFSLPEGTQRIDAETTWKLLDRNRDGHISASQWSTLVAVTCR